MVIKKYPQSNLVLAKNGKKICIDPGNFTFQKGFKIEDFSDIDAFLITHQHADHMDDRLIGGLVNSRPVIGNADVVSKLSELGVKAEVINDGESRDVAGFNITAFDLPHCKMIDGTNGPPNTGFLVDEVLFHPGDGSNLEGLKVENLAIPIAGPSISFKTAFDFAKQLSAKVLIPIHYDAFVSDPEFFKQRMEPLGFKIIVLNNGEEVSI